VHRFASLLADAVMEVQVRTRILTDHSRHASAVVANLEANNPAGLI